MTLALSISLILHIAEIVIIIMVIRYRNIDIKDICDKRDLLYQELTALKKSHFIDKSKLYVLSEDSAKRILLRIYNVFNTTKDIRTIEKILKETRLLKSTKMKNLPEAKEYHGK